MKTVLFVPGFQEDVNSRDYKNVFDVIKSKGYLVQFVSIDWKRTIVDDWVSQLELEYQNYDAKEIILAGFSYGSLTALIAATKQNPSELWLFSLSPYFADDIAELKQTWLRAIGKRRTRAFSYLVFGSLAEKIQCKTLLFVGELEVKKYSLIGRRAHLAQKYIKRSQLYTVPAAGHDIGHPNYIAVIKSALLIESVIT